MGASESGADDRELMQRLASGDRDALAPLVERHYRRLYRIALGYLRERGLMTQKIPEQLEVRREWPRAGTGKIVKKSLRDEYATAG